MKSLGVISSTYDPCLFYIGLGSDTTLIVTYVDDILIALWHKEKIAKITNDWKLNLE